MKRLGMIALLVCAVGAGFLGSILHNHYAGKPVQAQERQDKSVRIAIVNLEECARQSGAFKQLKINWDAAQNAVKKANDKLKSEYETLRTKLQRGRIENRDEEELLSIQVELKSIEEQQKVAAEEQEMYLRQLLNQYQKDVLQLVMSEVERFAALKRFDVVFQDYTVDTGDAAFFTGSAYAQALLAKPVLYTPGTVDNSNAYVTDITSVMVDRLRNLKLPPRKTPNGDDKDD